MAEQYSPGFVSFGVFTQPLREADLSAVLGAILPDRNRQMTGLSPVKLMLHFNTLPNDNKWRAILMHRRQQAQLSIDL